MEKTNTCKCNHNVVAFTSNQTCPYPPLLQPPSLPPSLSLKLPYIYPFLSFNPSLSLSLSLSLSSALASSASLLPISPWKSHNIPKTLIKDPFQSNPKWVSLSSLRSSPSPLQSPISLDPVPNLGLSIQSQFTEPLNFEFLEDPSQISPNPSPVLDGSMRRVLNSLRRQQIEAEAEAWARAAEEYKELERVMLEKKLAPSLPYVKSLFLGWFEPLRDAIEKEQKLQEAKTHKASHARHIAMLSAEKLAVIVMHKMMGLLMMGQEDSCVKVVHAAIQIGEAVEQEVMQLIPRVMLL